MTRKDLEKELPDYKFLEGKYSDDWKSTITHVFVGIDNQEWARMDWEHQYDGKLPVPYHSSDGYKIWARLEKPFKDMQFVDAKTTAEAYKRKNQDPNK